MAKTKKRKNKSKGNSKKRDDFLAKFDEETEKVEEPVAEEPAAEVEESVAEEPAAGVEESAAEEPAATAEEPVAEEPAAEAEEQAAEEPAATAEESVAEEPATEAEESTESDDEAEKANNCDESETSVESDEQDAADEPKASDFAVEKKSRGRKRFIALAIVLIVLAIAGLGAYRYNEVEVFPTNAKINGVPVGGMNTAEAVGAINKELNFVSITKNGKEIGKTETSYIFDAEAAVKKQLKMSAIDARLLFGMEVDYDVPLKLSGGVDETATRLEKILPDEEGTIETVDAHINYEDMSIVEAVSGNNTDYTKLAKDIAKAKVADPRKVEFEFDRNDYIAKPVKSAADMGPELEFANKYLADGMELETLDGYPVTLSAGQLSKIIIYTEKGPKYSKQGAEEVAKEVAEEYTPFYITVKTCEGDKDLPNYVIAGSVNVEKTAESIYDACKNGKTGKVIVNEADTVSLKDRVEVSITNQTLYLVQDGKVVSSWLVVTGRPGWETAIGVFEIAYKTTNAKLVGTEDDPYEVVVSYWMPFNGGAGLHDAIWQSSYGGSIYLTNSGSHGCVGMSLENAEYLFYQVDAGMPVLVYY